MDELISPADWPLDKDHAPLACYVGFSGGLDSTVLLHTLTSVARAVGRPDPVAIHVNHGLSVDAQHWADHCVRQAEVLGIRLHIRSVRLEAGAGVSTEMAARTARYRVFDTLVPDQAVLVLGHHANDQAETVLFRLMRGTGVAGLGGMRSLTRHSGCLIWRPLLDVRRSILENWALDRKLAWIEDPSNRQITFARNYLRERVLPVLEDRWPAAVENLTRTAQLMQSAQSVLNEIAEADLLAASLDDTGRKLDLELLAGLSDDRRLLALRHWIRRFETQLPSYTRTHELARQIQYWRPDGRIRMVLRNGRVQQQHRHLIWQC
jgi:tRNA(Ile)-lysidine synthase